MSNVAAKVSRWAERTCAYTLSRGVVGKGAQCTEIDTSLSGIFGICTCVVWTFGYTQVSGIITIVNNRCRGTAEC